MTQATANLENQPQPPSPAGNASSVESQRILNMPAFVELQRKRGRMAKILSVAMLVIYYGFVMLIAFTPTSLATPVVGVISLGIVLGLLVILSAIVLTAIYVMKANSDYDPLVAEIVRSAK